ncbi:hypothetical protein M427DRAFT_42628 [Gonapodya prolifera JEL478]|uniref:Uncharacterized protein n=1 Tax=Gonapodya prolifera (strain JEL478) TaxID=1344416 RepID=A0A139ANZ2_GONPJ|nr:hypothetical protein M427DRAFT_42628 [Gonapodya prolifera JEL478]|eukprot:KXS18223.1 hypothetical protein M427DRAFT_42628 [Gonapodya prolifera JEL478]
MRKEACVDTRQVRCRNDIAPQLDLSVVQTTRGLTPTDMKTCGAKGMVADKSNTSRTIMENERIMETRDTLQKKPQLGLTPTEKKYCGAKIEIEVDVGGTSPTTGGKMQVRDMCEKSLARLPNRQNMTQTRPINGCLRTETRGINKRHCETQVGEKQKHVTPRATRRNKRVEKNDINQTKDDPQARPVHTCQEDARPRGRNMTENASVHNRKVLHRDLTSLWCTPPVEFTPPETPEARNCGAKGEMEADESDTSLTTAFRGV